MLYFRFTLQARGQWKHWNDVVKNLDVPEKMTNLAVIPTLDTARLGLLNVEHVDYAKLIQNVRSITMICNVLDKIPKS